MPIIAALSVQYSNFGIKVFIHNSVSKALTCLRHSLLAETPPAIANCLIPVSLITFFAFFKRT